MLAKLMKYDFKSLSRYLIVIHAMLLVAALLGRVLVINRMMGESGSLSGAGEELPELANLIMGIIIVLFIIIFMAAVFGTLVLVGMYFYKNLFSDEAYLTHTLPVSRGQLLASKTIVGSAWLLIDNVLLILSVVILAVTKPMIELAFEWEERLLGSMGFPEYMGYGSILLAGLVFLVVGAFANAATLYVSVAVGQLFSNHRALGAVVSYFCICTVVSIVSSVIGAIVGMGQINSLNSLEEGTFLYGFLVLVFVMGFVFELVMGVIFYIITWLLMQKKLNLN